MTATLAVVRAAIARGKRLVVDELPEPVPGSGEALVAVRACGICGSDLHTLEHADKLVDAADALGMGGSFDPGADYVMGHEFAAEVLELAPDCTGVALAPGDVVVSIPVLLRAAGLEQLGYSNAVNGGFSERMLLTAGFCLPVPDGLDARRAALTEPMAVGLHAVNRSSIRPGEAAVVAGCGPIGLAIVAWLAARGIEPVVAADYSARRRAVAAGLGAHEVVDPRREPLMEAWRRVDGRKPVVAFEAVGAPGILDQLMTDVPPQSRIVVAGVCMQDDVIRPLIGVMKEVNLQFVFAYEPVEFAETLRAIAGGDVDAAPMITGVAGIDGVAAAFDALADPDEHVKIIVEPGGPGQGATFMPPGGTRPVPRGHRGASAGA